MTATKAIRSKVSELPHKPGIYLMKDRLGTVIYVGKARDLRKRVSQYFHPSRRMGWDVKFRALVDAIHDFDVHTVRGETEALLLESRLIKQYKPRYNVSFCDDKRYLMLKVNLNDPIPRFALTRLKLDDNARYFGPFPSGSALKRTLDLARHKFNLRGCKPFTPGEHDYKHCLYGHLEVCSAPCVEKVTREQYRMQVENACDFLDGQCTEMLGELETAMHKAAESRDYERAAKLRDQIDALRETTRKTTRYHRLPNELPLAIDPDRDLAQLAEELGLSDPPARIFWVNDLSLTKMKAADKLAEVQQHFGISLTSAHEAYPGHHLQFVTANTHRRKWRPLFAHAVFYEGWTLWCEQMMTDLKIDHSPWTKIIQLHDALWRVHRILVDLRLHSGRYSYGQGVKHLQEYIGFTKARAEADVNWYTSSPAVPMSYWLGRLENARLHRRLVQGRGWSLKRFNDWLLSFGTLPQSWLEKYGLD